MSSLTIGSRVLGRCTQCIATVPVCTPHQLRLASTVAKAAKPLAKTPAASVPKKKISTKSSTAAAPAKSPRKKADSATSSATGPVEPPAPAVKKATRAASTKASGAAKSKSDAVDEAKTAAAAPPRTRKVTPAASKASSAAAAPPSPRFKAAEASLPKKAASTSITGSSPLPEIEAAVGPEVKQKVAPEVLGTTVDPSSPEYKRASRRYVSVMVALPILLVTSYFLFDRLALGHTPKSLYDVAPPAQAPVPEQKD